MPRPERAPALSAANLSLACVGLVLALYWVGVPLLDGIELRSYDLRFRSRGPVAPAPEVVLAVVDEKSLDALGRWPWPRTRMAELVDALSADGARVIGFDIGFLESEGAAADASLAGAIARSPADVVLGYFFHMEQEAPTGYRVGPEQLDQQLERIAPTALTVRYRNGDPDAAPFETAHAPESNLPELAMAAEGAGFFTLLPDDDGVVRRTPLVIRAREDVYPSLALASAWRAMGRPPLVVEVTPENTIRIQLGEREIPTDPHGRMLIDFPGPTATYPHVSVADVLAGEAKGRFRDRIVLVGVTATAIYDLRAAPFGPVYPGLEVQAAALGNLLTGRFVARPLWANVIDPLAIVVLGVATALLMARAGALGDLVGTVLLGALYLALARQVFVSWGYWLGTVYPLLSLGGSYTAITVHGYFVEQRERRRVASAFGHYVSPVVIEQMLADPAKLRLGGEERVLTVLFCDLVNFTTTAEQNTPQQTIELLSEYYARMTERVYACEGMLKEYVGDELMAIFGAPIEQPDHAARACRAALELRGARALLSEQWAAIGRPRLRARTGINTGRLLVGNIGSEYRFSYGVVGDAVNLGSRLEHLNRFYGTEILIGEQTAELVGDGFRLREVDRVRAVGKRIPVRAYELIAEGGSSLAPELEKALDHYAAGLAAYRERRWQLAIREFEAALAVHAADGPSRTLADRCRGYSITPPADDWEGVFEVTEK